MPDAFGDLLTAIRDELAALDTGDAAAIERATAAKLAALGAARTGGAIPVARLHEARALNALAATRTNMLLAGVDRRLAALTAAAGRGVAICYGRDGRTSAAR
ncbi:hypothetical protein [Polymorphobacter megasporae]|uniref:hypothetical protein n=1 Tax=Glacieibacterium megasporae TaxID=2835787 RepID=UPI001C1E1B95|nr:hypothetical protein [Polymorphobacter megasporae]UAJ08688.1 hypothetical protein KTC28_09780 [Polymorphobacter megasporae]